MTIGAYEAKTHLPRLLDEVARGKSFVITKHGKPTARLVGVRVQPCGDEINDEFAAFREGRRLGFSVADAIAEGRL